MLPNFNELGDLPVGIHRASIDEIKSAFGSGPPQGKRSPVNSLKSSI